MTPDDLAYPVTLPSRWTALKGNPFLRAAVGAVNTPVAVVRGRAAYRSARRPLRIEIGGTVERPGWLMTNISPKAKHYLDATRTWPFEDGAAQFVYSDNVIEHVPLPAVRRMLAETFRVLRPGGVARIVTPDLRRHVELYLQGRSGLDDPLAAEYRSLGIPVEHPLDYVRVTTTLFGHAEGYSFDFDTLRAELERAGFAGVVRRPLGESDHPDLVGLDSRPDEGEGQMAVEATRP